MAVLPLLVAAAIAPAAQGSPFVTGAGTQLQLDGSTYRFTGLNIYNSNSTGNCWYGMASGSTLDDSLTAMGSGKNAFRSWFFQSLATVNGLRDWSAFDHTLAVARNHGFKVIATLTNQWGDCESPTGYKDETWYDGEYQVPDPSGIVSYADWVAEVVSRYKDDPTILAWQLVNEAEVKPSRDAGCSTNAAGILESFAADVSGVVKSIDPNHLVSLGTMGGGQCGAQGTEYADVHSVPTIDLCEYHDYQPNAPMPGDQWNGLQVRIDQCKALNKPIFVGETGIVPNDVGGTLQARADAFEAKFNAQFSAGVVGELVWAWSALGSTLDNFDVGPGDPVLGVLAAHAHELGYPRPKGATPTRVSLVPAYEQCESPNRTHGPPLSYGSCAPPAHVSPNVTVGTADANGAPANSVGFVQLGVQINTPPTPNDVLIAANITDVRCKPAEVACGSANSIGGSDYTGELQATTQVRITDKLNPLGGTDRATVSTISFPVTASCSGTANASIGGTCAVTTSGNAVMPGSIKSGMRTIWQLGQIQVLDGGRDGVVTTADNLLFEGAGIFVP